MTRARDLTRDEHFDHGQVAGAHAHLELLAEVASIRGLLSLEDAVDAWRDLGELRRLARDFGHDPLDALPIINELGRRLGDILGHRRAA